MNPQTFFLCTLVIFSLSVYGVSSGMTYIVLNEAANTPGGQKFDKQIGIPYAKEIVPKIHMYIWNTILQQTNPADRRPIDRVEIFIRDVKGYAGVMWDTYKINISADYLNLYRQDGQRGDLKWEFTSLLYHEITHIFQWRCEPKCNVGLVEGIADYTILKANYYYSPGFAKPGTGNTWDQGYDFTARFLEYCDTLTPSFTAKLNKMMRYTYSELFFQNLTGKPVQQLWKEYKAKYGQPV